MVRFLSKTNDFFLHIPRTGGSWVQQALDVCEIKSLNWLSAQPKSIAKKHCLLSHLCRNKFSQLNRIFTFVRHPVSYYESVWGWLITSKGIDTGWKRLRRYSWHPHLVAIETFHEDFNIWIRAMLAKEPCWYTRLIEQYVGPRGGEFCNYIGRTENLVKDFHEVMSSWGHEENVGLEKLENIGRVNPSVVKPEWDSDLLEQVLYSERKVLERFYGNEEDRRLYGSLGDENEA